MQPWWALETSFKNILKVIFTPNIWSVVYIKEKYIFLLLFHKCSHIPCIPFKKSKESAKCVQHITSPTIEFHFGLCCLIHVSLVCESKHTSWPWTVLHMDDLLASVSVQCLSVWWEPYSNEAPGLTEQMCGFLDRTNRKVLVPLPHQQKASCEQLFLRASKRPRFPQALYDTVCNSRAQVRWGRSWFQRHVWWQYGHSHLPFALLIDNWSVIDDC